MVDWLCTDSVCVFTSVMCVAPPIVGAWSMAVLLWQFFINQNTTMSRTHFFITKDIVSIHNQDTNQDTLLCPKGVQSKEALSQVCPD